MQYTQYGPGNAVVSSGSAGGASSPGVSMVPFGHYWNSAGTANSYNALVNTLQNQNGGGAGLANAQWTATNSGTILSVELFEAGPANGTHTIQFIQNSVTSQAYTVGTGGNGAPMKAPVNIPFAIGDTLSAQVANTVAGNTQVQVTLTLQLNP